MSILEFLLILWIASTFRVSVLAYIIHNSCRAVGKAGADDTALITQAMTDAFVLVDAGIALASKPTESMSEEEKNLIKYLFLKNDEALGHSSVTRRLDSIRRDLSGLRDNYRTLQPNPFILDPNEIIIMCNLENILKSEIVDGKKFFFVEDQVQGPWPVPRTQKFILDTEELEVRTCLAKRDLTLGFTGVWYRPTAHSLEWGKEHREPERVVLCTWVLDYWRGRTFRTWRDMSTRAWIARFILYPINWFNKPYRQIDLYSWLDKLLVHEMTHGHNGGNTHDILIPAKSTWAKWFKFSDPDSRGNLKAYGWKAARYLAENGANNLDGLEAHKNADSIALFCLASRMLEDGFKIEESGRIIPPIRGIGGFLGGDGSQMMQGDAHLTKLLNTTFTDSDSDFDTLNDKVEGSDLEDEYRAQGHSDKKMEDSTPGEAITLR